MASAPPFTNSNLELNHERDSGFSQMTFTDVNSSFYPNLPMQTINESSVANFELNPSETEKKKLIRSQLKLYKKPSAVVWYSE